MMQPPGMTWITERSGNYQSFFSSFVWRKDPSGFPAWPGRRTSRKCSDSPGQNTRAYQESSPLHQGLSSGPLGACDSSRVRNPGPGNTVQSLPVYHNGGTNLSRFTVFSGQFRGRIFSYLFPAERFSHPSFKNQEEILWHRCRFCPLFISLIEPILFPLFIYKRKKREGMMPSDLTNPADAGRNIPCRNALPGAPSQKGWSVFLCDSAGNVVDTAGTVHGPCLDDPELPPGRRLLYIRK